MGFYSVVSKTVLFFFVFDRECCQCLEMRAKRNCNHKTPPNRFHWSHKNNSWIWNSSSSENKCTECSIRSAQINVRRYDLRFANEWIQQERTKKNTILGIGKSPLHYWWHYNGRINNYKTCSVQTYSMKYLATE